MDKQNKQVKNKSYYEANKLKLRAAQKAYYEENKAQIQATQKAYREANRERIREKALARFHRLKKEQDRE